MPHACASATRLAACPPPRAVRRQLRRPGPQLLHPFLLPLLRYLLLHSWDPLAPHPCTAWHGGRHRGRPPAAALASARVRGAGGASLLQPPTGPTGTCGPWARGPGPVWPPWGRYSCQMHSTQHACDTQPVGANRQGSPGRAFCTRSRSSYRVARRQSGSPPVSQFQQLPRLAHAMAPKVFSWNFVSGVSGSARGRRAGCKRSSGLARDRPHASASCPPLAARRVSMPRQIAWGARLPGWGAAAVAGPG